MTGLFYIHPALWLQAVGARNLDILTINIALIIMA